MRRQNSGSSSATPASSRRKRITAAATAIPLAIGLASTQLPSSRATAPAEAIFAPACTVPFASLEQHHPLDDSCGVDGNASADTPQGQQNEAKNNFCAAGSPVNVNFDVLHQLQEVAASRVTFGSDRSLPKDRSELLNLPTTAGSLGEGTVVRVAAFIMDAHPSNASSGGESVNCKTNGAENNDIHIVLAESSDETDQCNSATAEMSPHLRPDLWNPEVLNERDTNIFPNGGPKHMFRFTGQLFFDASHKPCTNGRGSPKRSTIWEIHPVYAVEICIDPNMQCTVDSDANWQQLIDFAAEASSQTRLHWPDTEMQPQKSSHRKASDALVTLTGSL
jgi:hypothetical protein